MHNKIYRKLSGEEGSSIIVALILFLICTFAASGVLAAASLLNGSYSERLERKQQEIFLKSAAMLIAGSSENICVIFEEDEEPYYRNYGGYSAPELFENEFLEAACDPGYEKSMMAKTSGMQAQVTIRRNGSSEDFLIISIRPPGQESPEFTVRYSSYLQEVGEKKEFMIISMDKIEKG